MQNEKNSAEWDKIKQWVGKREPAQKHPLEQIADRERVRIQKFDDGGVALPPDVMSLLEPRGAGLIAPSAVTMPAGIPPQPPQIAPPPAPVAAPPVPTPPPAAAPEPSPDDFNKKATDILGGMTPEMLAKMYNDNYKTSPGEIAGIGLAGIGDAISSIGGRDPGAMKNVLDQINRRREAANKLPGEMATMGKQRFEVSQTLQAQDPNSPYSRIVQKSQAPVLQKMGWSQEQINGVAGQFLNDAVKNGLTYEDVKAKYGLEKEIHEENIGMQKAVLKNTEAYQKGQQALEKSAQRAKAAGELAGRGPLKRASDWVTQNPGTKALEREAGITAPEPDHSAAFKWASSHPDDPRAKVILQRSRSALSQ